MPHFAPLKHRCNSIIVVLILYVCMVLNEFVLVDFFVVFKVSKLQITCNVSQRYYPLSTSRLEKLLIFCRDPFFLSLFLNFESTAIVHVTYSHKGLIVFVFLVSTWSCTFYTDTYQGVCFPQSNNGIRN